ncbi:MAG: hypothetical protein SCK70_11485, partial [bacterium]|nr:hypothetical protein [bacterium]
MKHLMLAFISALLLVITGCGEKYPAKFSYLPEKPLVNQEITVKYDPTDTDLKNAHDVSMLVYQYVGTKMPTVAEVSLDKKGKGWVGNFTPIDSALVMLVVFTDGDIRDNNDQAGYFIQLFDESGDYLPNQQGVLANAYYTGAYPVRIKRDVNKALELLESELAQFPDQQQNFNSIYFDLILRTDRENGKQRVKDQLEQITAAEQLTYDEKVLLASWYTRVDEEEKAEFYRKQAL